MSTKPQLIDDLMSRMTEISWQVGSLEEEYFELEKKVNEMERGIRVSEREEISKEKCECEHERCRHGKSFSINYTGGACRDCKCQHFLPPKE